MKRWYLNKYLKEVKDQAIKISGTRTFHTERNTRRDLEIWVCLVTLRDNRRRRWVGRENERKKSRIWNQREWVATSVRPSHAQVKTGFYSVWDESHWRVFSSLMLWFDLCFNRLTLAAMSKLGYGREGKGQSRKKKSGGFCNYLGKKWGQLHIWIKTVAV